MSEYRGYQERQVAGRSTVIPIGSTPIAGALFGSGCE